MAKVCVGITVGSLSWTFDRPLQHPQRRSRLEGSGEPGRGGRIKVISALDGATAV
jgi:hypothetical protein